MQLKNFLFKILLLTVIILPVLLNVIPIIHAFYNVPKGMFFVGNNSWFDPWDVNVYVSVIKYGQNNGLLLENFYTTIPHNPVIFYPLYTITGLIFKSINPYLLFHALASFSGFLTVIVLWFLAKEIIKSKLNALISVFLISLGGGFGWLLINKINSPDITMTGFTLMSAFQRAHESLGIIIFALSLVLITNYHKNLPVLITVALFQLIQVFIYPYLIISFFIIVFIYDFIMFKKKDLISYIKPLLYIACLVFPVLLWYTFSLSENPGFNLIYGVSLPHPSIIGMISGYGFLLPLVLIQIRCPVKNKYWYLLNLWIFISIILSYLPFGFARFYLKSLYIPAVLLVFLNLKYIVKSIKLSSFTLISVLIIFLPLNSLMVVVSRLQSNNKENLWVYNNNSVIEALDFLNKKTLKKSGVLSLYQTGNLIPAKTYNRVYFGHMLQTPNSQQKINQATLFYSNKMTENEARKFIQNSNITYIYYGKDEKNLTVNTELTLEQKYPFIRKIYDKESIIIYEK